MQAVIDIGGSNSKFYTLDEGFNLKLTSSVQTPKDPKKLLMLITDHINCTNYSKYSIGLPGPIYGNEKQVFLPPLDFTFDIWKLYSLTPGKELEVGNDCSTLHKAIKNNYMESIFINNAYTGSLEGSICMTIGTSFGVSAMTQMSSPVSLELAHIPISCVLGLSHLYRLHSSNIDVSLDIRNILNTQHLIAAISKCKENKNCFDSSPEIILIRELIIGSSILASKLLGIKTHSIIIVSGAKNVIFDITRSVDFQKRVKRNHPYIESIKLYHQDHIKKS